LTVYDCWERQDPEDCDNLPPLKRRHIETRDFGSNIRRSMLSKLDQMERAYIWKHLALPNVVITDEFPLPRFSVFEMMQPSLSENIIF
jgi:hypothetical protein